MTSLQRPRDNTMKMNVRGLVDGFIKFLQVSSHCNVHCVYDVLEEGVFARTDLSDTFNVSAMCFVIVVFCLCLMKVSKRLCLRHCWQEPIGVIRAFNINTITKSRCNVPVPLAGTELPFYECARQVCGNTCA